jgi:hypothetical protein
VDAALRTEGWMVIRLWEHEELLVAVTLIAAAVNGEAQE